METQLVRAGSGLGVGDDWQDALSAALEGALEPLQGEAPDLLMIFASAAYTDDYAPLLARALEISHTTELAGCSASAVIAGDRELEEAPGVAALAVRLPPGMLLNVQFVPPDALASPGLAGMPPSACNG